MTCPREISKPIPKCCPYEEKLVGDQNGETESCEIDSTTSNYHMSISINGHIYTEEELKKEGKFKHEEQKVIKKAITRVCIKIGQNCFVFLNFSLFYLVNEKIQQKTKQ